MQVIHDEKLKSYARAELRSGVHFQAIVWWADRPLDAQDKGEYVSFEISYPCWIRLHGVEDFPIVQFVEVASEEVLLGSKPWPDAIPVLPGVSWLKFDSEPDLPPDPDLPPEDSDDDPEPEPTPTPTPAPGSKPHRVLIITEVGSVPIILKPSMPGEVLDLTIIQRKAEWFDQLKELVEKPDADD